MPTASAQSQALLSWSHYLVLLQVKDQEARAWYEPESFIEAWSVRTLQRNVSSQYYYRLLSSQVKEPVYKEMHELTVGYQDETYEFVKNPIVAEFLGFPEDTSASLRESKLEQALIDNLQKFLLELGKGYAFVAR